MNICCPGWIGIQPGQQTVILKRLISTNCCLHKVVHPDDGPRYAQHM